MSTKKLSLPKNSLRKHRKGTSCIWGSLFQMGNHQTTPPTLGWAKGLLDIYRQKTHPCYFICPSFTGAKVTLSDSPAAPAGISLIELHRAGRLLFEASVEQPLLLGCTYNTMCILFIYWRRTIILAVLSVQSSWKLRKLSRLPTLSCMRFWDVTRLRGNTGIDAWMKIVWRWMLLMFHWFVDEKSEFLILELC